MSYTFEREYNFTKDDHRDYLIQQIITVQTSTPGGKIMSPILLRDYSIHQLQQYLITVKRQCKNRKILHYFQIFFLLLTGYILGKYF